MRLLPRDFGEASWHRKLWKCSQSIESWKGALESKPLMHWRLAFAWVTDSAVPGKQTTALWATTTPHHQYPHHHAHAAWGCPPSRRVCLSCQLGAVVWPLCLQERRAACVLQLLWKHGWKTRPKFPPKNSPWKKPARTNKPSLMKDHLG